MASRVVVLASALSLAAFAGVVAACGGESDVPGSAQDAPVDSGTDSNVTSTSDGSVTNDSSVLADSSVEGDSATSDAGGEDGGTDASPQTAEFNVTFNAPVRAAVHAGRSWYFGGDFTAVNTVSAPRFVPMSATGAPISTCQRGIGFDGLVTAIVRSGSSVYFGGSFKTYNGQPTKYLAKLDAVTCALDTTFSPSAANGFDQPVLALAVSGTALYVGGAFTSYRGIAGSASRLAKLSLADGTQDTTFSPAGANANGFNNDVESLAVAGTSLYAGGIFTSYKNVTNSALRLAKLDLSSGAIDTTFSPAGAGANGFSAGHVYAMSTSGTSLYLGGTFTAYRGTAGSATRLAKINLTSGALDTTFSPPGASFNGFNDTVHALAASATALYVGGEFSAYRGVGSSALRLAKLDLTNGALDTTFTAAGASLNGVDATVNALAVVGTDLVVGGNFVNHKGIPVNHLLKVDLATATRDTTFGPMGATVRGVDQPVTALAFDGTTLDVGGDFANYAGRSANHLAKFDDTTYAFDETFSPPGLTGNGFDGAVNTLAASSTALYVGGAFASYRGSLDSAHNVAKLDLKTGDLDATFSPVVNGFDTVVNALVVSGTSLYAGGSFSAYRGIANSAKGLAKLDLASGAIDAVFSPVGATANGFDAQVNTLAVLGTALYAGGDFAKYRGVANSANRVAKVDLANGEIDATFSPPGASLNGFNDTVHALAAAGTSVYVGGRFTAYKGVANSAKYLAKLDATSGAQDTAFSPVGATANGVDDVVYALASDGTSLFLGGAFTSYRGVAASANHIAKLAASGALDTTFSPPGVNGFTTSTDGVVSLTSFGGSVFAGGQLSVYRASSVVRNMAKVDAVSGARL